MPGSHFTRFQRWKAHAWFIWGASLGYWGLQTHERSFFRAASWSFERAIANWPLPTAYYRRGVIRGRELGDIPGAIADLTQAIALDPEWPEPYLQRGLFERFHGTPEAAVADLQRYLELGGHPEWRAEASRQLQLLHEEREE